ncbi:WAT1-related protein At5g64700-like isoform X2 [Punica granatum]|uniref:WAT1-related protein n=1 Tax=Punica granatum TaxID=22663 RepID=A0A6P8DVH7_PUNGR|nr:WAT1-related protein At5g64700-like isoform X2 [Punica granatum]
MQDLVMTGKCFSLAIHVKDRPEELQREVIELKGMDSPTRQGKKPYLAVVLIQAIYAGMFLLSKVAFDLGMNTFVFVFYRQAAATILLAPLAYYFEWENAPPLSVMTFFKIFMLSLFGMESLELGAVTGMAKLAGVGVCLGGAATLAFYKGPHFSLWSHHHHLHHDHQTYQSHVSSGRAWIKGCFLMLSSNTLWALWLVLQGKVMKSYESKLRLTTLQCFLSSVQSFIIAIPFARDPHEWRLGWNIRLLSVAYCGIVVTGVTYYLQTWVIEKRGPVFLAMSTPLSLVITLFFSAVVLHEIITLGSILGGVLLVGGLYSVLWGKSREQRLAANCSNPTPYEINLEHKDKEVTTNTSSSTYN